MDDATSIATAPRQVLSGRAEELAAHARDLMDAARSPATRLAYGRDWLDFERFCASIGVAAMPADPAVAALYIADMDSSRGLSLSTIQRRLAAVSVAHAEAGAASPTTHPQVRQVMAGLRRVNAHHDRRQKRPLGLVELRRIVACLDEEIGGLRDRSLLLTGFVGGLRRSELVALNVGDLDLRDAGYVLRIRRSKTDQEGRGRSVVLPYSSDAAMCPVLALQAWLEAATLSRGPVFRRIRRGGAVSQDRLTPQSVALVVKQRASAAGLDASMLAGHSLRAGFATHAASTGASERAIANQTGHRSMQVLRGYIRQATVFDDNAATGLGL